MLPTLVQVVTLILGLPDHSSLNEAVACAAKVIAVTGIDGSEGSVPRLGSGEMGFPDVSSSCTPG